MNREDLYSANVVKAEKIATSLCWKYRISGTLDYQEEARSEARLALWDACCKFDPSKQILEIRKILQQHASMFWNPIFSCDPPSLSSSDPCDNFWIWAVRRVYGRIIDWFRSYRLIKRMGKNEERSMLYHKRFLSMTRESWKSSSEGDGGSYNGDFCECIPSEDRADEFNEVEGQRKAIQSLMSLAGLSPQEIEALSLVYGDDEMNPVEVAEFMGISPIQARRISKEALSKLKAVAHQDLGCSTVLRNSETTRSIDLPILVPAI